MKLNPPLHAVLLLLSSICLAACAKSENIGNAGAPPPVKVEKAEDVSVVSVDHPEQFPLVQAASYFAAPALSVTGTVNPDISRTVPVISLASGRVLEIRARLGDTVQKGQVLLLVQSNDVAGAFSDYRKALADEVLAKRQLDRAQLLYDKGAISLGNLQVAQDAEDKAKVDVETALEHLRLIGVDKDHPSGVVEIKAPVSGVITDQQVTNAAGVQALAGPNPFTISNLSSIWIVCDVYENDLRNVHLGETAQIVCQRISRQNLQRNHQQYWPDSGPQHPHRQSAYSGCQPQRPDACRHVCHRHVSWAHKSGIRVRAHLRHSPSS